MHASSRVTTYLKTPRALVTWESNLRSQPSATARLLAQTWHSKLDIGSSSCKSSHPWTKHLSLQSSLSTETDEETDYRQLHAPNISTTPDRDNLGDTSLPSGLVSRPLVVSNFH